MNKLLFLVYGILFLILSLYLILQKTPWSMFTLAVGIILVLLYAFLPEPKEVTSSKSPAAPSKSSSNSPASPIGVLPKFSTTETLQSPILRNTFNYINDPQINGSSGRLEYGNDKNMRRWGIKTLNYTHAKFDDKIFKFRNPNSSDSYGYFVDKFGEQLNTAPDNFFKDFIKLGTFS
jgi:hypothetical protein